ncbi:MAG: cell envelope integrity protein CreD [Verrucomicrobiae bacterium]|nr:cell envelope integrity protein CreD [Verrucomicrobiae bacterium]
MNASNLPPVISRPIPKTASPVMKLLGVGGMAAILLIPLGMIGAVLNERLHRRNGAVAEITSTWGRDQELVGPVLMIPYRSTRKVVRQQKVKGVVCEVEKVETFVVKACFLPQSLDVEGNIRPEERRRGIYRAVVYSGSLKLKGVFSVPDFGAWKIDPKDVLWEEASISMAIPDLRGVREGLQITLGAQKIPLGPGSKIHGFNAGVWGKAAGMGWLTAEVPFELDLTLNGSSGIRFAPVGVQNTVKLDSSWPDPSFQGAFLPVERKVDGKGFSAIWRVSYYGRNYPQQWLEADSAAFSPEAVRSSLFGVAFIAPIDSYRNVERSTKYGALFVALVFAAFFLFEILARLRVHPLQYLLVGAALCLFFLALLSLSELLSFGCAYFAAALVSALLVTAYAHQVLKSGWRTLIVSAELAGIYGFLYVILQLQDYSLMVGTLGLFLVLAAVMYVTRKIDWYAQDDAVYRALISPDKKP